MRKRSDERPRSHEPADLNLLRQWFNTVQDLKSAYLQPADYALAARIHEAMGLRVPAGAVAEARAQLAAAEQRVALEAEQRGGLPRPAAALLSDVDRRDQVRRSVDLDDASLLARAIELLRAAMPQVDAG